MIVVLVVLPPVTEVVKGLGRRCDWWDARKLGPPIAGAVSLLVYTTAWAIGSRDLAELQEYAQEALVAAYGAVSLHSLTDRFAPRANRRMEQVTGSIKLGEECE